MASCLKNLSSFSLYNFPTPMATTRFFSHTLPRNPLLLLLHRRHLSTKPHQPQLIDQEVDSSTSQNDTVEVVAGIRNLEEAIQSIIARRAAPDWLPFLPGYSYYAPPPPAASHVGKFFEVFRKLSDAPLLLRRPEELSNDVMMSFSTNRGLPSSTYFIGGTAPTQLLPMGLVVNVKIDDGDEAQESSDEE